ncbi:hypothetical protein BDZ91DRAFT_711884 [Kalaharituber pfeilii]|nr:hypothetical protein BDZ91DRAFT_711884 [Kalaharituber pfeilii]
MPTSLHVQHTFNRHTFIPMQVIPFYWLLFLCLICRADLVTGYNFRRYYAWNFRKGSTSASSICIPSSSATLP